MVSMRLPRLKEAWPVGTVRQGPGLANSLESMLDSDCIESFSNRKRPEPRHSLVPRLVTMLRVTPGVAMEASEPPVVTCISSNASKSK